MLLYSLIVVTYIGVTSGAEPCEELTNQRGWFLLNQDICGRGRQPATTSNRIAWGNKTSLGDHPWMAVVAVIKELPTAASRRECAGTLINDRYVLTAASCFAEEGKDIGVVVYLRIYQKNRDDIINCDLENCALPPVKVDVERVIVHPDYNLNHTADNIALIRLKENVVFDEFLKPICLPLTCDFRRADFAGTITTMLGFDNIGVRRTGLEYTALEKAQMLVVSRKMCQDHWYGDKEIMKTQICAIWPNGVSSCEKDMGGPLLTGKHTDSIQMYQIGIITEGECKYFYTNISRPTIFTNVGDYVPFILKNIY